jgi:DNA polymerase III subunit delta
MRIDPVDRGSILAQYGKNIADEPFSAPLQSIYWLSGQQLAMKSESIRLFKAFVKREQVHLFRTLTVEQNQDVLTLKHSLLHADLWSEPTAVIVYLSAKTSEAILPVLASYVRQKRSDRVVLLISEGLKDKCSKAIWSALKSQVVHYATDVPPYAIQDWLRKVFKARGYSLDGDALAAIEAVSEGNRTLCSHLVTQVGMLFPPGKLTRSDLLPLLTDQAQFNGYQVVDAALLGNKSLLERRLRGYPKDASSQYALWVALRYNLRQIHDYQQRAHNQSSSCIALIQSNKSLWNAQKKRLISAVNRHDLAACAILLFNALGIDFTLKGVVPGPSDQMLRYVLFQMAGVLPVKPIELDLSSVLD